MTGRTRNPTRKKAFVKILDKDYTRIVSKYPRQVRALEEFMRKTAEAEKNKETNLDLVAGLTGEMLGEIMCWREDEWQEEMRTLGFYMGKFIYLMDAYEDYEADQKKNCYNPLVYMEKERCQNYNGIFLSLIINSKFISKFFPENFYFHTRCFYLFIRNFSRENFFAWNPVKRRSIHRHNICL